MVMHKRTRPIALSVLIVLFLSITAAEMQPLFLAHGNFFPDPGSDLPRIYIRSDGSVEPTTAPIERVGSLYKLTGNIILQTIEIQISNIALDGVNHVIYGNASWVGTVPRFDDAGNNGIVITRRSNVSITHVKVEKCTTGIRISNSSQIIVSGNTFTSETAVMYNPLGIAIKDSSLVSIENNNFTSISGSAIACNGTNNIITGNIITDVAGSMYGSIHLEGSSNLISNNKIEAMLPITMDKADSNKIERNNMSGPAPLSTTWTDINTNRTGSEGIALFGDCSNNMIIGNNITGFVNQAIRTVFSCSSNTIFGNYMANNGFAVALQDGAVNNTFYGNTFAMDSCKIQIDDGVEGTFWDNRTIGNFWGNYNGTDNNKDGISDTPYIVNGVKWDQDANGFVSFVSGQDNYPLMEPYNIEHNTIQVSMSSPTQQPTSEPSFSPTQKVIIEHYPNYPMILQLSLIAAVVISVIAASLVHFKKRRG
jgi:parallel beta-helix repeat protein